MDREPGFGRNLAGKLRGSALGVDIYGRREAFDRTAWTIRVSSGFISRIEWL